MSARWQSADAYTLCGYGGGMWRKRRLLDHEAAAAARSVTD